ncbi:MAG: heme-dependent peroxidase [Planctomycetaceae bacterium]|nr:heme-dependent peroxidase [Planctomycetaceae bacterium]
MNRPHHTQNLPEPSVISQEGWHCSHYYYSFDRSDVRGLTAEELAIARQEFADVLNASENGPERLQVSIVSGHKADFGLMIMDPNPLTIDRTHQRLLNTRLGSSLSSTYSFVSVTEISEYVPTIEQYAARLVAEGEDEGGPSYEAKINAYKQREPIMRKQRLTPDFPEWPATCFYPMNKIRLPNANWFMMDHPERNKLMAEHARSGMEFAGKVLQLITTSVGLDDWEWGVTLWARNPEYLKDIVYRMRFDEASAKYAEFGPFYTSYIATPEDVLHHCGI